MDKKIITVKQDVSDLHVNFEEGRLPGADMSRFQYYKWWGDDIPRGIIVYSHGLVEYGKIFESSTPAFVKNGFIVYSLDHIAHGKTPKDKSQIATWDSKSMTKCAFNLHALINRLKKEYPELPIYVIGYDFGSIAALRMLGKFKTKINGFIFTGMHPSARGLKKLYHHSVIVRFLKTNSVKTEHMAHYLNKKYNYHSFFGVSEFDWITSKEENLNKLGKDKVCIPVYTVDFYYFFFKSLLRFYKKNFIKDVDRNIPLFVAGGSADSVNRFGRGTIAFANYLKAWKFTNVKKKIYDGSRHNLFLDFGQDNLIYDIIEWTKKIGND